MRRCAALARLLRFCAQALAGFALRLCGFLLLLFEETGVGDDGRGAVCVGQRGEIVYTPVQAASARAALAIGLTLYD